MTLKLAPTPLVAILRGVKPDQAEAIAGAIVEAGFGAIEVPLNSPEPLASIARIALRFGDEVLVGAGTVLEPHEVEEAAGADGFGVGSALYKPGASVEAVGRAAQAFVKAWNAAL